MQASNPLTMISQELCLIRKSFILHMSVSFMITVPERFWKPEILVNFRFMHEMVLPSQDTFWLWDFYFKGSHLNIFNRKKKNQDTFTIWIRVREIELRALAGKYLNNLPTPHRVSHKKSWQRDFSRRKPEPVWVVTVNSPPPNYFTLQEQHETFSQK